MPSEELYNSYSRSSSGNNYSIVQAAGSLIYGLLMSYTYNILASIEDEPSENNMFVSSYQPIFNVTNNLSILNLDSEPGFCLVYKSILEDSESGESFSNYSLVESKKVSITNVEKSEDSFSEIDFEFSEVESAFFKQKFGYSEPLLQVEVPAATGTSAAQSQVFIKLGKMNFNSLTSMGEPILESFEVSNISRSDGETISTTAGQISDVGGTISRNRILQNTDISETIENQASDAGIDTYQGVTTSGY